MKVLHIATGFQLSFPGGITNYVRTLAQTQIGQGIEVHVLARPEQHPEAIPAGVRLQEYSPATVHAFALGNTERDPQTKQIWRLLDQEHFDFVHIHMALDLPLEFLRRMSTERHRYIVSLHDYYYLCPRIYMVDVHGDVCHRVDTERCRQCIGVLDQVNFLRRVAQRFQMKLPRIPSDGSVQRLQIMREFLEGAALLLPVSTRVAEIYTEIAPHGRYEVAHIGNLSADQVPASKTFSEKIRLRFIGTLNVPKGAEVLQQLIAGVKRKDVEFHFHGRDQYKQSQHLRDLGLIVHGGYKPADLDGIMADTDVGLVLPIWEDNGPQVVMEFINFKVPVIGTRRGGIPDFVTKENGFLFDPDRPDEIAQACAWIDGLTREQLQQIAAGMRALTTPAQHAQNILEIYQRLSVKP